MNLFKLILTLFLFFVLNSSFAQKGLIKLIEKQNLDKIKEQVAAGKYDVNLAVNGIYPLVAAYQAKNIQIAEFLLENGADPNIPDGEGRFNSGTKNMLRWAVNSKNHELVKLLIKHGGDINSGSHLATLAKEQNEAQRVLAHYINTMMEDESIYIGKQKYFWMDKKFSKDSLAKYFPIAVDLIKAGAKFECKKKYFTPPLYVALQHENYGFAMLCIEYGADVNFKNEYYSEPVWAAIKNGHFGWYEYLKAKGATATPYKLFVNLLLDGEFDPDGKGKMLRIAPKMITKIAKYKSELLRNGYHDEEGFLYKKAEKIFRSESDSLSLNMYSSYMLEGLETVSDSSRSKYNVSPIFDMLYTYAHTSNTIKRHFCEKVITELANTGWNTWGLYPGYDSYYRVSTAAVFNYQGKVSYIETPEFAIIEKLVDSSGRWYITPLEFCIKESSPELVKLMLSFKYDDSQKGRERIFNLANYYADYLAKSEDSKKVQELIKAKVKPVENKTYRVNE